MENPKPHSRMELAEFSALSPETVSGLRSILRGIGQSGLEPALVELVEARASQLNGCAFCVNMHVEKARTQGVSEARLQLLCVWRESPVFSDRERAALAWTETVTLLTGGHVPDDVYQEAREQFSEKELAYLTATVAVINAWNRLGIAYCWTPDVSPL